MDKGLIGMGVLFSIVLLVGLTGFMILSGIWTAEFASLAALSSLGLGITGYALITK
jgi:hypothetical protein